MEFHDCKNTPPLRSQLLIIAVGLIHCVWFLQSKNKIQASEEYKPLKLRSE